MKANELRRAFTGYFEDRGHTIVPSASLVPHDPTVLFTVAGMVPFKPYFVGDEVAPWPRVTTVQKCVRAGGKHNDLDEIGISERHLTFFEMLGNFSFGDYFKAEAIPMAWDFVTEVLGLDGDRLWATVHTSDDEAHDLWHDGIGLPVERIQRFDEDNFWRMAETGPCGPSSEIFFDKGPSFGIDGGPAANEDRYIEIWNLVFMQFDQQTPDRAVPLPKPSIDTGAGLERLLSVVEGVGSVYELDEIAALVETAAEHTGTVYGADERADISVRILAEHARTMTFLISDGVFPTNEERGYALRRIMRRAIRHAYLLGVDDVVTPSLVDKVVELMGADYPDLVDNQAFITGVVQKEEERFRETLRTGSLLLDAELGRLGRGDELAGGVAFLLHDTYGFPVEVTQEIASEQGIGVDLDGFDTDMAAQRKRAKDAQKFGEVDAGDLAEYHSITAQHGPTDFVGREAVTAEATVLAASSDGVVLDRTPFYAESGGQVGDTGDLRFEGGCATVVDTTAIAGGLHLHHLAADAVVPPVGVTVTATIDAERRDAIRRNHTATHLVHSALRQILGDHVKQQGSLVEPDRLRFDFSHYEALTPTQIADVEDLVNAEIMGNSPAHHFETTMDHARELGAIAFFGDKYGDAVRVLQAGDHSLELCGGTHVDALGDIGSFAIVSEGSIGSNIRRIEAVSGMGPLLRLRAQQARLDEIAGVLGVGDDDLVGGLQRRLDELKSLRKELETSRRRAAVGQADELVSGAVDGVVVARVDGISRDDVRDLAVAIRDRPDIRAAVLGSAPEGGGVALVAASRPDSGLDAGDLLVDASKLVKGGGGRDPELAVAGGKDVDALDDALDAARRAAGI
ncbi:MAG: alanine--tRNA ligase [Acidimicrobiia bacterium]|nr:alanine--tRNA ligase [Acidimicrobiia bacterium]